MTVTTERMSSLTNRGGVASQDIDRLVVRLARARTEAQRRLWRNRVITACVPIADNIAYRFAGRGEPADDLFQVARLALVKTVDRFDPDKGHFLAFAVPTIRGELRRYFRDHTWMVRVPRPVQEVQLRSRHTTEALSQRLGRSPTPTELADELGVNVTDLGDSPCARTAYRPMALDAPVGVHGEAPNSTVGAMQGADDPGYEQVEDLMTIKEAIADLDPRRKAILRMIFFECLPQREVATRLGVSQVQISRLLHDTLARVRARVRVDAAA